MLPTLRPDSVRSPLRGLVATLFLLLFSIQLQAQIQPVKSPNDDNQYRYLTLDNGLRALLVSDADADQAAAALNVSVGSGDDPAGREGMAHFLEHMLFLGTEKYPDPGEYQQFINSHGGSHNAFTAFQDTNYFFDVQPRHLEPALDRFAQQFSAPLFSAELVDRERNAVHSEYTSSLKDDNRRYHSARKAVVNPAHAYSQFSVGNLTTLDNTDERPLREELVEFWRQHYSANLMTLTVFGPQSLDELEAMVRPRFVAIDNRELTAKQHDAPLFESGTLPGRLQVEALKDIRRLQLTFPIPSQREHYRNQPARYLAGLLGHEGEGSLFNVLRDAGLAESLSAGMGMDTGEEATLELNIELTREGLEQQDRIVALAFRYIDLIRDQGISKNRFEEIQQLARIEFRFQEQPRPMHLVMRLAMQMNQVAPKDVLRAPWMMKNYVPDQYRALLDALNPNNLLVSVLAPEPLPEDAPRTKWYDTPYQFKSGYSPSVAASELAPLTAKLALPEPNPFVPENLSMVAGTSMEQPAQLAKIGGLDLWHALDTRFDTPNAAIFLSLRTPQSTASARSHVLTELLTEAINTGLNAWAYPAREAGLDYRVYPHLRGITVRVEGYSDKLPLLMSRVLGQVAQPSLTPERFRIARQQLIDSLRNSLQEKPVQQAMAVVQSTLVEGAWTTHEKLAAARDITLDELRAFAAGFTEQVDPVMLVHGNVTRATALNTARLASARVLADSRPATVPRSGVRQLPAGQTLLPLQVDHPDTGYVLYSQGEDTSFAERARFRLLAQVTSSPFYEEMRTNRQLGYIVYATSFEMLETPGIGLVVQSPDASAEAIDEAVTAFSREFEVRLDAMNGAALTQEKAAVTSRLLERERRLEQVSERYWREIDRNREDFDSRQQLAEAVDAVTHEELMATFRQAILEREPSLRVITASDAPDYKPVVESLRKQPTVQ